MAAKLGQPSCLYYLKSGPRPFYTQDNSIYDPFLLIKRSRLAIQKPDTTSGYRMVRFSDARYWHKIESEIRPRSGFRMLTVLDNLQFQFTNCLVIFVSYLVSTIENHTNSPDFEWFLSIK
jgi:hypothetical protein